MFLAESSEVFCRHLLASDALVALFAELPTLSPEQDEELLHSVLDNAIANDHAPWWQIPPRGERPLDALARHRPRDIAAFLRPYIEHSDEIPQLWGTACVAAWGGTKSLNKILDQIAHDPQRNVEARIWAIEAIAATKDHQDVHALYDLFDDPDDQIRAQVLQAYRQLDAPTPQEFIAKLKGGSRNPSLLCLLQSEAEDYGHLLEMSQLSEALQVVTENFEDLGNLKRYVLRGLFSRAIELNFADIPANLIIKCWIGGKGRSTVYDSLLREEKTIPQLLTKHPGLFEKVWTLVFDLAGRDDERLYSHDLADILASVCTDRIFALLPSTAEGLTWPQQLLIVNVIGQHFRKEPTPERLLRFQQSAPVFTQRLRLPQPPKQPPLRDPLEDKQKLLNALKQGNENPLAQTWHVLRAAAVLERKIKYPEPATEEEVLRVLARIAPTAKRLILKVFRGCVARVQYKYEKIGPDKFSMTSEEYETPFWVLRHYDEKFTSKKLAEILSCYAFSGIRNAERGRYEALCEELRHQDWELWRQCMWRWLEEDSGSFHSSLQYLIKIGERFYLPRCAERLEQHLFGALTFSPLLDYLLAFRPAGYIETLRRCYRVLKDRLGERGKHPQECSPTDNRDWAETGSEQAQVESPPVAPLDPHALRYWDQFRPLLALMGEDGEWTWDEFAGRLAQEDVPLNDSFHVFSGFQFPLNERRLPVLAGWYALIRRKTNESHVVALSLARRLLETIVTIGGQSAIQELQRLQQAQAFPGARWLSHEIMRIEDALLAEGISRWSSGPLLDFINKEKFRVVLNEHDLFMWVCQAIEEVQDDLEQRGESVAGFWDGKNPKTEPECQNILWPLLRRTLLNSSIATVEIEEFPVGPNYCDFWVQYPRSGQSPLRVAIELKTARKGYGPAELIDPIESQLWGKYMRPTKCQHGIFIVLWFRDGQRYKGPTHWASRDLLAEEIRTQCKVVTADHQPLTLVSYIIDLTAHFRKH